MMLFTVIYNVPQEFIYDVLFIEGVLKQQKPLLLVNSSMQYLTAFMSVLAAREQRELMKVYDSE